MSTRRTTVARLMVAVTTIVALVAPLAVGAAGQSGSGFDPSAYWETIEGPNWQTGPQPITQYMWDPHNTNVLYVTNGKEIQVSGNQGDSWRRGYVLPALTDAAGFTADDSTIVDLQVDEGATATDAYAVVEQSVGGTIRPHVIASHDGGRAWAAADIGLPLTGRPIALRVAPNDPNIIYLALAIGDNTIDVIYRSDDFGATWTLRSDLSKARPQVTISGIEVDPQESDELWAPGRGGLHHSSDGGASFEAHPFFNQGTGPIDIYNGAGPARLSVFVPGLDVWYRSDNAGRAGSWGQRKLRGLIGAVSSVAHGLAPDVLFVTAGGSAYAWNVQTLSWVNLEPPAPGLQGMVAARGLATTFSAHTPDAVYIYSGPITDVIDKLPAYLIDVPQIVDGDVPERFPPRLDPRNRKVVLERGERKTVSYQLKVAPRPLPLDVYFVLDTSASTTTFLQNVARSVVTIANGLGELGIEPRFGLADYRAYPYRYPPREPCGPGERASMNDCEANYAYRQRLDLGPDHEDELVASLETLTPDAGGEYRSMYAALYQSVTGEGQDVGTPNVPGLPNQYDHDIPEGQQAHFEKDSYKVIVHATDESWPTNESVSEDDSSTDATRLTAPNMTGKDVTRDALVAGEVYQVGLATGTESRTDLKWMARQTGAIAPEGGVDCNGNGTIDIPAGEPLVCEFNAQRTSELSGLAAGIEGLLLATTDAEDVTLETGGGTQVIKKVTPNVYDNVLQSVGELDFAVTFSCPRLSALRRYDVELKAVLVDRSDPTASTTVVCRPPDAEPEEIPPLPPVPPVAALVALAIPPPPPPPPPILEISSASQSQSQAQAQAGMVHQEEKQPQFASASAFHDPDEEFAFSRYREESESLVTPIRALGAGAAVMSFAFGFLMMSQELAREKVFNRRR